MKCKLALITMFEGTQVVAQHAAEKMGKSCTRYRFNDTGIYQIIENASFSMAVHPDNVYRVAGKINGVNLISN